MTASASTGQRFASAYNSLPVTQAAIDRACSEIETQLKGQPADLVFVFITAEHCRDDVGQQIRKRLGPQAQLLGASAEGVIGTGIELEAGPALSLWAAALPGMRVEPFHVTFSRTPDGIASTGMPAAETTPFKPTVAFLLGDAFSTAVDSVIEIFAEEFPGLALLGGMASSGQEPGENRIYLNDDCHTHGAVGLLLGNVRVQAIVSQGCRPVGRPFVVTKAKKNLVFELGGLPAPERLRESFGEMTGDEQRLFQRGPFVGLAVNEYQEEFKRGDFLIANLIGVDPEHEVIAISNLVRTGQTVQFHVRDAATADEDLRLLLKESLADGPARGALVFSCNGRGSRMFPEPHHDAAVLGELVGPIPAAGFFAQGELGPLSGRNHMHGFTASIALFD